MDYVINDITGVRWPGALPYRGPSTRKGRGYKSEADALRRIHQVEDHYNRRHGTSPGMLVVVARFSADEAEKCDYEGHAGPSWWVLDAQGVELCRVCERCEEHRLARYRPEILSGYGPDDVSEPIGDDA